MAGGKKSFLTAILRIYLDCLLALFHRIELLPQQRTKCAGKRDSLERSKLARKSPFFDTRNFNPLKIFRCRSGQRKINATKFLHTKYF